ncbi:hypothetical protein [Hymenobacter sp. HDW8]|uniref:hypothetical protein n=1 Tax=Hymenobacter sp. HDW8 TaxID=2714932 RepID=UPI001408116A|nr:hypothetical protein [Hymenobacter sp. HDW8]QIL75107.1 hypothetical protein G7064_03995 [Hymenobacter sp. HDW8]
MLKRSLYAVSILAVSLLLTEVILRKEYGLGDAILFRADNQFEYIAVPQRRFRFHKTSFYNRFSQRNRELMPSDTTVILGFGDSVINGGAQTDQDSLATTLLSAYLSKGKSNKTLVINIGAGSWGPDNCFAYLQKYGDFGAKAILLVVSSHDAYDNMSFKRTVGVHPSYPKKQYRLALFEVVAHYVYPRYILKYFAASRAPDALTTDLVINKQAVGTPFNSGFANFNTYARRKNIPLVIYLHADKAELKSKQYNRQGQEILSFCRTNAISVIQELDYNFHESDYRDVIHLSEKGQRHMFSVLKDYPLLNIR